MTTFPITNKKYTFEDFIVYGIRVGGNVVNGLPWSFKINDYNVTHENDNLYILSRSDAHLQMGYTIRFERGNLLCFDAVGRASLEIRTMQTEYWNDPHKMYPTEIGYYPIIWEYGKEFIRDLYFIREFLPNGEIQGFINDYEIMPWEDVLCWGPRLASLPTIAIANARR